ncbi:helix-turn-helix domain-containing protein [Nocardioides sp.]|uniref:MarR family winged helix-turn-helix transcriptional regulator n=1 Tax=Nocardioides sp. TaxID=35761 RepID=UPI002ED92731
MTEASPRTDRLRGLEQEVGVMVRRIRRVIRLRAQAVHPELPSSSYLMLSWLITHGAQRSSAMAEAFGIDKGAISRQLQHLVELDLVDRSPDPDDGRATLISASAAAADRMAAVADERRRWLDARLGDWSEADLDTFVELLRRYNHALEEHPPERALH